MRSTIASILVALAVGGCLDWDKEAGRLRDAHWEAVAGADATNRFPVIPSVEVRR